MHFSWALLFGNVLSYAVRSLRLTLFLERPSGKSFGLTPGGGVKTLFLFLCLKLRGNAVRFFFFVFVCLAQRPLLVFCSFLSLRVAVWNKFSGANFCFLWSVAVLCFSMVFCLGFRFMVWCLAPESVQKKVLFMSGLLFWVRSLLLRFPVGDSASFWFSCGSEFCQAIFFRCFVPLFFPFPSPSSLLLSSFSSLVWPGSPFVFSALCPGRRPPSPGRSSIALHALLLSSCLSLCPGRPPSPSLLLALSLSLSLFLLPLFLSLFLSSMHMWV